MQQTIQNIRNLIDAQVRLRCERPTVLKNENLLDEYRYPDFFREKLGELDKAAQQAINESNPKEACVKWQNHFGSRFSCANAKDEDELAKSFANPVILGTNAKSAS